VHFFRPLAEQVRRDGGQVLFCARDKDVTLQLLEAYGLPHTVLSQIGAGALGLAGELASRTARLVALCREQRPDALLGIMGPCIAPAGRICGIPSLVCYDTETAVATNSWVFPLATRVLTPASYRGRRRPNQRCYEGTQELAYLHPRRFRTDPVVLARHGLDEPFALVRFVSFEASHDLGDRGFHDRAAFVAALAARIRVVISAEREIPPALRPYQLTVPPQDLHHVLAGASLVVGEGATTAAEAAVLGTPAVFVHTARLGYMDELEHRYGLLYRRTSQRAALRLALELLEDRAWTEQLWARRRSRLLASADDLTARLFVEMEEMI